MDVNIFVYAHREDTANHLFYRQWLESVINSNSDFAYSPLVLSGFLRIITHPKVFEVPTDLDIGLQFIKQITSSVNAIKLLPKDRHWQIFEDLIKTTQAKGNFIPNAYHAALAIESGCEWVSSDKGFKKFHGLRLINPLLIPPGNKLSFEQTSCSTQL